MFVRPVWVGWSFAFFTVSKVSRGDVLEKKRSSCRSGGSGSTSGFWWSSVVDASGLLVGVEGWCFLPVWSDVCSSWAASEPGQTSLRAVPPPHVNNLLQCMLADTLMLAALPPSLTLKYFIHRVHVAWNGCCRSQAPLWVTHTFSSDSVSPLKFVRSAEALRARGGAGQAPDGLAGIVPPSGGHLR